MTPQTNILMDVTGQNGALSGNWYHVPFNPSGPSTFSYALHFVSGTGTVVLDVRNDPNSNAISYAGVSASGIQTVTRSLYVRLRITAATNLALKAVAPEILRPVA
jgi:hypothetical protein